MSEEFATARLAFSSPPSECFSDSAKVQHLGTAISASCRLVQISQNKDVKKRSQQCDYVSKSMQNLSAIHFTMCGGSTLMPGFSPIRASSLWYGLHQLNSVRTVTPAHWASCCFVIAFITILFLFSNYHTYRA